MTVGVLLLAGLQDILSGGGKTSVEVLFAPTASAETFGAACALATALDEATWALYSTSIIPQVLTSTAHYISSPAAPVAEAASVFDETVTTPSTNSLILLSRLSDSGRLGEAIRLGSPAVKGWERTVGAVCERTLAEWVASFAAETSTQDQVS